MEYEKASSNNAGQLARGALDHLAGKYLTFCLAAEEYGLEILKVREIIGLMNITAVPRAPRDVRGVINLRGKIIPVIDLRKKFDMPTIADTDRSCIIVVDATVGEESLDMGILVDSVSEVLDIHATDIGRAPSFGNLMDTSFITGMAKTGDKVTILLGIEEVLRRGALEIAARAEELCLEVVASV